MKLDDVSYLLRDLKKEMPFHTSKFAKIPLSFSQGMPKDPMETSNKTENKILNKYLGDIEEADHFNLLTKKFKHWFLQQNIKYHQSSGILNHDNFFKKISSIIPPQLPHICSTDSGVLLIP